MPLDSTTSDPSIWSFIGPAAQIGAGLYGSLHGSGQAASGYNAALGSAQTAINTSAGALAPYQAGGEGALGAYENLLGIGGVKPNFDAFTNSPGYQFELNQGNQAIQRAANAAGNGFSSTTLAQLANYDQGLAATHYQQYLQNMYGLIGVGANAAVARGNQALTGAGIAGGAQVGAGVSRGVGSANASGVVATGLSKLPWGQIGSGVASLFGGGNGPSGDPTVGNYANSAATDVTNQIGSWQVPSIYRSPQTGFSDPSVSTADSGSTTYWGDSSNPG